MSKRTHLTLASFGTMMLPYRPDFLFTVLVLAAIGSLGYSTTRNIWYDSKVQVRLAGA